LKGTSGDKNKAAKDEVNTKLPFNDAEAPNS
jgi:hypothetical protein